MSGYLKFWWLDLGIVVSTQCASLMRFLVSKLHNQCERGVMRPGISSV